MIGVGLNVKSLGINYQSNCRGKFNFSLVLSRRWDLKNGHFIEPEYRRVDREEGNGTWSRKLKFGYEKPGEK